MRKIIKDCKNRKKMFIIGCCILLYIPNILITKLTNKVVNANVFASEAEVSQNTDKVGANIWLKQTIHGMDGINYRYVIETDCPKWDFQTRYMTAAPIEWIDETSAVEVIIYDTQVRYNGTVYASGQYYTVPLLGGISSENVSLEEWQKNLVKQAYQTYASDMNRVPSAISLLKFLILAIGAIEIFDLTTQNIRNTRKKKEEKKA